MRFRHVILHPPSGNPYAQSHFKTITDYRLPRYVTFTYDTSVQELAEMTDRSSSSPPQYPPLETAANQTKAYWRSCQISVAGMYHLRSAPHTSWRFWSFSQHTPNVNSWVSQSVHLPVGMSDPTFPLPQSLPVAIFIYRLRNQEGGGAMHQLVYLFIKK